jgi:hypothetical protein
MWYAARRTSHSKIMGIYMELVPLCCPNSLHSSGKAFHQMLEHCCGDLLPFSHKSIREVGHITPENVFSLLHSPMAASFTSHDIAHGDLGLVCGCSAMETNFMKLLTNSSCADVPSRGSLELDNECCNWGHTVVTHYTLQHSAIPFCVLVWPTTSRLSRCCS